MKRIHIVGRKNSGKTRLVVELVQRLAAKGLRVATIKHTHHQHELDTPGKDSWLHRQAGASIVGVLARNMTAVFLPQSESDVASTNRESRFDEIEPLFRDCDWVIVEGNLATQAAKIEVWRSDNGVPPIYLGDPGILAVVSDDALTDPPSKLHFPRTDLTPLIEWLLHGR